ncbi:MAG: hypothetical protein IJS40_01230 [Synergistaceae bacterium]|nr:hypothetical protein [Synergistaceae bacterium]
MLIRLLLTEEPQDECRVQCPKIFRIVQRHVKEIGKVRELGYSWRQIAEVMREMYPDADIHAVWIERYYKRITGDKNGK